MNQVLPTVFDGTSTTASPPLNWCRSLSETLCISSPWNRTVCNLLFQKYFSATDCTPGYAEDILRLLHQFLSPCSELLETQTWAIRYIRDQSENFQARFNQHCDRQEWSVASLVLDILQIVVSIPAAGLISL